VIEGFLADLMPPFIVAVCPQNSGWGVVIYDMREVCPSNPKGIAATHKEPTLSEAQRWASRQMVERGVIEATPEDPEPELPWESLICGEG